MTWPTSSLTFTVAGLFTSSRTSLIVVVRKPVAVAVILYGPGMTWRNEYAPVGIAGGGALQAGLDVLEFDRRAGNDGAGRVGDHAGYLRGRLREQRYVQREQQNGCDK